MGCISSKQARSPPPPLPADFDSTTITVRHNGPASAHLDSFSLKRGGFGELEKIKEEPEKENEEDYVSSRNREQKKSRSTKKGSSEKKAVFSLRFGRYTEAEQIAAGWPPWLSAVAGEAVEGWLPLRADLFEKLDKVGQGTYSSVYRARDIETGRIVALKKVRFDTFQPESVRFMAREITILRMLDHPNIMKLEGLITNRLSCSIYLVFEYMEHDLSGLLSCRDIKFSDSQIKCYMRQLLAGLEHCHSRGVMHRDIKASNILVNNEGILKIADFGLANYINVRHRQALTSRVVTLWYRPPELLLGSTNYGAFVDMWSAGCVFAELFIGKPILKGRTEVEQLHKIFRLCGSPPDEYWKKSNLPLATMFKPQHPYVSSLREMFKEFPKSAVNLLETFLSIEPHKRGTASSALVSEELESTTQFARRNNGGHAHVLKAKGASESWESLRSSYDTVSEASQATEISQVDSIQSVPAVSASTDFAWAKKGRGNGVSTRLRNQASSRGQNFNALDPSSVLHSRLTSDSEEQEK
ncbi:protein kinase superfamily protein [Actinidia rufa]|uniref:[RNA-polymerase]-subunit kinase n=1 Tax=Actinidia rufa TaxID=165716 RepID=A0A7J0EKL5_9ERIC|nr:protein kinase superfamily protein [Actinidia rufa]